MNHQPLTDHEVFWLARHAHNVLQPLIKAAQQYEPSIQLSIAMQFQSEGHVLAGTLNVLSHWQRPGLFLDGWTIRHKDQITHLAAKVQTFIDTEQAALEAAEDAKSEEQWRIEQADALADRAWDAQLERMAERADIERDEHDRDIDLQNEYAGN